MRKFTAVIEDDGLYRKSVVNARDRATAEDDVKSKRGGKPPAQLIEGKAEVTPEAKLRIKLRSQLGLFRSLSSHMKAGLTSSRSLDLCARTATNKKAKAAIQAIAREVSRGKKISAALARFPNIAPPVIVAMISAGEEGGKTAVAAEQAYKMIAGDYEIQRKVKAALIYPAIVLFVAAIVVTILMWKAVPVIGDVFKEMNVPLPLITRWLINSSDFMRENWVLTLSALSVAVITRGSVMKFIRSPFLFRGRPVIHQLVLRIPALGALLLMANEARLVQTLAMLLTSGQTFSYALKLCRAMSWLLPINAAVAKIEYDVSRGEKADIAFSRHEKVFTPTLSAILNTGRESGDYGKALTDYLPEALASVEDRVNLLKEIMTPALIIFLAIVVGGIVGAIFMPLFQLPEVISK